MNKNIPWDDINRRSFMKISAAAMAAAAGSAQLGKIQAARRSDSIKPFKIEVPDAVLKDLRKRLSKTRFPDQLEDVGWSHGTDLSYLKELCAYWLSEFDWRAQERALNRFDHFRTEIDGLSIHFIHQRSKEKNSFPLFQNMERDCLQQLLLMIWRFQCQKYLIQFMKFMKLQNVIMLQ